MVLQIQVVVWSVLRFTKSKKCSSHDDGAPHARAEEERRRQRDRGASARGPPVGGAPEYGRNVCCVLQYPKRRLYSNSHVPVDSRPGEARNARDDGDDDEDASNIVVLTDLQVTNLPFIGRMERGGRMRKRIKGNLWG